MIWLAFLLGLFVGFYFGYSANAKKCDHDWKWRRNTHGDEINHCNYRTVYQCEKCGKFHYSPVYTPEPTRNHTQRIGGS